jgi:hypothetical protein
MQTVDDVFVKFGGPTAFADAVGIKISAASEMRRRSSIPVRYWSRLVDAARVRHIRLTYEKLVFMHSADRKTAERVA